MPGGRFALILRAFLNALVARVAERRRLFAVQPGTRLRNVGNITRSADDGVHQTGRSINATWAFILWQT